MKKTAKIVNIIAIVLIVLQLLSLLGSAKDEPKVFEDSSEKIGYYIGYNFVFIIAAILFIVAYILKRKVSKREQIDLIDSIGRNE